MGNLLKYLAASLSVVLPAMVLGALAGAFPGYKAYEYVWTDARFCTSCHVHDYATVGWAQSIHGEKTTCHDCHHQPLRAYFK
ncbi:MAG TPA: NapC/NirT family cytochrome c, partial [Bdellovibrionales bacterium]|nr:NapC/NirT family cytochrome c [Bdellovibrionales bacterium]